MASLDDALAGLGGGGLAMALVAALLLGARHAADPDHLAALSTLALSDPQGGPRGAERLGLAWGAGHALTLLVFGLPVVLYRSALPEPVQRAAEATAGLLIAALALRMLVRWRRGHFEPAADRRRRASRRPLAAFGVGLVHGLGGSAAAGILVVGALPGRAPAAAGLLLFASASALSMFLLSSGVGRALGRAATVGVAERLVPGLGALSLGFGAWYAALAL